MPALQTSAWPESLSWWDFKCYINPQKVAYIIGGTSNTKSNNGERNRSDRFKLVKNVWFQGMLNSHTKRSLEKGEWLWSHANIKDENIKGANKDAKIYVGRSVTVHNPVFYACTRHLCNIQLFNWGGINKTVLCVQSRPKKWPKTHSNCFIIVSL